MSKYNQMKVELNKKKMTLWKSKDVASWEVPPDKLGEALAVKNDATKSFEFMLPKVSKLGQKLIFNLLISSNLWLLL